jgi:hypothetical protein
MLTIFFPELAIHTTLPLSSAPVFYKVMFFQSIVKPKLKHQLNSTEFEVRLHSDTEVHPPTTTQTQLVYLKLERADSCPEGVLCTSVSPTQTSVLHFRGQTLIFSISYYLERKKTKSNNGFGFCPNVTV